MINLNDVKDRIKELRNKLKMTQEEFGEKIGLSKSGISNIEKGTRNVSPRHIKLICSIFDINESWLKTGIDNSTKLENFSKTIRHFDGFINYLESLGYGIEIQKAGESEDGQTVEQIGDNGSIVGQSWIPDEEFYIVILKKDNIRTEFTGEQFIELQESIEKAIAFEVFKKRSK